ncbi:agmatine deiminase family protein, partial [Limnospira sp. Paracas R14]|uniref:agmatine deiminase family protein n=1 Tax=Limnospira sp. Paracas R14 TaxID=2981108 RepID=UPI0028E15CF2|nr:agmatine deiminase family protein [Limnospira sp. Paracas R14]
MQKNLKILESATDQDGKPFNIVRMPSVPTIVIELTPEDYVFQALGSMDMRDGSSLQGKASVKAVLAASYLNFIVANNVVLIPKYYKQGGDKIYQQTDEEALLIFQKVFPSRTIVQIDT